VPTSVAVTRSRTKGHHHKRPTSVRDDVGGHSDNGRITDVHGRPRAVAVGFEPTNGLPRYTLSSSANHCSATVVSVCHVLNEPIAAGTEPARTTTNETKTATK